MNKKQEVLSLLKEQGLLPLFYNHSEDVSEKILRSLYKGGIRLLEYTNRGEHALKNFVILRKVADAEFKDMQLGVGTVKSADDAKKFIDAGADFVVCPLVNPEVATITHRNGLLWMPGCFTNTEIYIAEVAGASLMKIFPGNLAGPSYISALKEIFPNLDFMPSGGVEPTKDNINGWFKSGVYAVGMGSKLISKTVMELQNYEQLTMAAAEALMLIKESRMQ